MPFHLYTVHPPDGPQRWFGVKIEFVDDRWLATSRETDANGNPIAQGPNVAPTFYGITADQAHRKMLEALENSFGDVVTASSEGCPK